MTIIASAWYELVEKDLDRDAVIMAKGVVSELLVPSEVTRKTIEHYLRKAIRSGAWSRLQRETRALILAARSLPIIKSPVLKNILRGFFLEIELYTLRGRAVFYGVLVASRQGLLDVLGNLKRLITLGISYLNLPSTWRCWVESAALTTLRGIAPRLNWCYMYG